MMKNKMTHLLKILWFFLLCSMVTTVTDAGPIPQGDTQVASLDNFKLRMGLQYRVMYNSSNIPLSGVTTVTDTESYDFFRQRMRLNVDMQPADNVGGLLQLEYRGGWGGTSPESSDPRGSGLSLNAFNRLNARGVRYGYIYYTPNDDSYLAAGIIPVSDQLGDTQFSADWDFNVGGIVYSGRANRLDYRLAYLQMVDGVASANKDIVGEDSVLYVADINFPIGHTAEIGGHVYFLNASDELGTAFGIEDKITQGWYSVTASLKLDTIKLNGFICLNDGEYGTTDNSGYAFKAEAIIPVGKPTLKILTIYTTGDQDGETKDQFRTVQSIFGTAGYWAYTHLFTPNGPSDVNDLGVGLDNGGKGLMTVQTKLEMPLMEKLTGEFVLGWFGATEDNAAGESEMGTEVSTMGTYEIAKNLNFQLGGAFAFMGDFYKIENKEPDDLYEIFSRFQLQF